MESQSVEVVLVSGNYLTAIATARRADESVIEIFIFV